MKAIFSGTKGTPTVTLIPETVQELFYLEQVDPYLIGANQSDFHTPARIVFVRPKGGDL